MPMYPNTHTTRSLKVTQKTSNQCFVSEMKRKTKRERTEEGKRGRERLREREREGGGACGKTEKDRLKSFKLFFPLNNPSFVQI